MVQGRAWGARRAERRRSLKVLHHCPKPGLGLRPQSRGFPTQGGAEPPGVLLLNTLPPQAAFLFSRCYGLSACSPQNSCIGGFPSGPVVKNLPASAGDMGLIPGPERSHMPRGS